MKFKLHYKLPKKIVNVIECLFFWSKKGEENLIQIYVTTKELLGLWINLVFFPTFLCLTVKNQDLTFASLLPQNVGMLKILSIKIWPQKL